jgi:hypothetical protein
MRTPADFPAMFSVPMERWFRHDSIREIGRNKIGAIMTAEESIIEKFSSYWSDFVPFIRRLIKICFPNGPDSPNGLTHDSLLAILREAYETVKEPPSGKRVRHRRNSAAKRRKLDITPVDVKH